MNWYDEPAAVPCGASRDGARQRQQQLTKPAGSLGRLETLAEDFAGWQQQELPLLEKIAVRVFAADHGVTAQGVSAFPATVTTQMIGNFLGGGAAISVLSRDMGADFSVINMGTFTPLHDAPGLVNLAIAPGTADFSQQTAMSNQSMAQCLAAGRDQVDQLDCDLFIAGDMGIGNTSSATAIVAALLDLDAEQVTGRGTGVDDAGLERKRLTIQTALRLHAASLTSPEAVLRCVGGLEIAGICGAYLRCAQRGIPILVDGFITTAAALLATRMNTGVRQWLLAGHQSAEQAHRKTLQALRLQPLLDLGMRLGEGSGAAVAVAIVRSALRLHNEMATFAAAGVADAET